MLMLVRMENYFLLGGRSPNDDTRERIVAGDLASAPLTADSGKLTFRERESNGIDTLYTETASSCILTG